MAAARSVRGEERGWGRWSSGSPAASSPAPWPPTRDSPPASTSAQSGAAARPALALGAGAGDSVGFGSLIHSFSVAGSLRPAVLRREEERGAAANEGPGSSRAPLCSAARGGQGLREGGLGTLPLLPSVRCAPSLLPAWKWLRLFSGE